MVGVRRALIVATDDYADPGLSDLRAPEHDAAELAAVLRDPAIGDFDVATVLNQPHYLVAEALAQFFTDAHWEDVLVVHFSCHGVKADDGQLFFASTNTKLRILPATAIPSSFVHDVMADSRAGSILLMLDCCYSGAFAKGMTAKAGGPVDVDAQVGGTGRAVITASDDMQFAFEDGTLAKGDLGASPSVFTKYVVQGLRTGEADRDQDGRVTLTEFYGYVRDEVVRANPRQTPKLFAHDVDGNLFLANRTTPATRPTPLDEELQTSLTSPNYWVRLGAVEPLTAVLAGKHPGRALAARLALEELCRDPDDRVKEAARAALTAAGLHAPVDTGSDTETGTSGVERVAWWRRLGTRAMVALAATALALVVLLVLAASNWRPGGGDDDNGAGTDGQVERLDDRFLLLSRENDSGTKELVAVDTKAREWEVVPDSTEQLLPTISPDREWAVVMERLPGGPENKIAHLVGSDGTERLLLDEDATERCPYTNRPAWSPDGNRLALVCISDEPGLVIVDRDGALVDEIWAADDLVGGPSWDDDGLVYIARSDGETNTLWSVPADGADLPQPVEGLEPGSVSSWDWSPNGLLYVIGDAGIGDVWVLTPDGTSDSFRDDGNAYWPTWSPDGSAIAWLQGDGRTDGSLWLASYPDGPNIAIPDLTGALGPPAWGSR